MGLLNLFKSVRSTDSGVDRYKADPGALLLDVRTPGEYASGHIPHSRNLPLADIGRIVAEAPRKETHIYVYCLSGGRSRQAEALLRQLGYANVYNIGGIQNYHGKMEV